MNAHKEQAEVLFQAGRRDLLSLQLLLESGRAPHESLGFHAQQASEKFIKTDALRYEGIEVVWVTDSKAQSMVEKLHAAVFSSLSAGK
jgi:HEPN domain-containing protein